MKKVAFFALAVYFSLSFILLASAGSKTVQHFDGYKDNAAFQKDATVWEGGADFNVKLSTKADSGKSMQIIPTGAKNGSTYGVVILQLSEKSQNWEGAEGIQFWAKATGGTTATPNYLGMELMFDDCDYAEKPERWACKEQMPYITVGKDGKTQTATFAAGGRFVLDDGFEGLVKIPFSSMTALGWSVVDDELQLGSIKTLYLATDSQYYLNKEIFIDTIQVYGEGIKDTSNSKPSSSSATVSKSGKTSSVSASSGVSQNTTVPSSGSGAGSISDVSEALSSVPAPSSEESGSGTVADPKDNSIALPIIIAAIVLLIAGAGAATYFAVLKHK